MCCRYICILLFMVLGLVACTKERKYTTAIIGATFQNADNTGRVPVATVADSIAAGVYAIKLSFSAVITGNDGGTDIKGETQYNTSNYVSNAAIYSLTNFDAAHPAGTSLADYFKVLNDTVAYQLKDFYGYITPVFDFKNKNSDQDTFRNSAYLVLSRAPQLPGYQDFVIALTLTDSTRFTDTLHIYLK